MPKRSSSKPLPPRKPLAGQSAAGDLQTLGAPVLDAAGKRGESRSDCAVKIPFSEYQRRGIVPLAGLALAAYYLFVLLPLARRAESLDEPLQKAWQKLSVSLDQTNATAIDFLHITNQLSETRQALLILENAKQQATARLQLGAAVRAKMHADFAARRLRERAQQAVG